VTRANNRAILTDAFEQQRKAAGNEAVTFDDVEEIAVKGSHPGGSWSARLLFEWKGTFIVRPCPSRAVGRAASGFSETAG